MNLFVKKFTGILSLFVMLLCSTLIAQQLLDHMYASSLVPLSTSGMTTNRSATFVGCTTGSQYPDQTFTTSCTGAAQTINTDAWAGEYAVVNITSNSQYTFSSSNATDYITISNSTGNTILAYGTGPLVWNAGANSGTIRYYIHTNASCGTQNNARIRYIACNGCTTPAPSAVAQSFCGNATVADLVATGTALKWFAASTGGTQLAGTTALGNGTYYVSQTLNSCESSRTPVAVTTNGLAAPTGTTSQVYAGTGTIANLTVTGTGLQWYAAATGGTALSTGTALTDGTTYYASQTASGCESATRLAVTVTNISAATQNLCGVPVKTVASLVATPVAGQVVRWYATANGGIPLTLTTALSSGSYYVSMGTQSIVTTLAGGTQGSADGTGSAAQFYGPRGITTDALGNVYVVDNYSHRIRKITPSGVVTTLAGGAAGFANGTGTAALFKNPWGIAIDASGNLYVADAGNHKIRKITPSGVVTTFAGSTDGYADGTGTVARFSAPTGLTIDASGNLYVGDTNNNKIRKITPAGVVTTLAGSTAGYANGTGTAAQFSGPCGVAVDVAGNVYVADSNNQKIRKITAAGVVTTLAGSTAGFANGPSTTAKLEYPRELAVDALGNVYFADYWYNKIRKITPAGYVTTLAGNSYGNADGTGDTAKFYFPSSIAVSPSGNLYAGDTGNNNIRIIIPAGPETNLAEVAVAIQASPAPVAAAQAFCTPSTVADLAITGTNIKWYNVNIGGTALDPTTTLVTGTYYATQTINGCESERLAVAITASAIPTLNVPATINACPNIPVIYALTSSIPAGPSLLVTQNALQSSNQGGMALCGTGTIYYRVFDLDALGYDYSLTLNSIVFGGGGGDQNSTVTVRAYTLSGSFLTQNLTLLGSASLTYFSNFNTVTVPVNNIQVPAGAKLVISVSSTGPFFIGVNNGTQTAPGYYSNPNCNSGQPTVIGGNAIVLGFNASMNGPEIVLESGLPSGSVFPLGTTTVTHSVTNAAGCTSSSSFDVVVGPPAVQPVAPTAQVLCNPATVSDLQATGNVIKWYDVATGGTPLLATTPLATWNYYVSQTLDGCESTRLQVAVTINNTPLPVAAAQSFCVSGTVADLTATGTDIKWYGAAAGGTALGPSTSLAAGTYYATQTLNGCESARKAVTVTFTTPPVITVPGTITVCSNDPVNYTIGGGSGVGASVLVTQNPNHNVSPGYGAGCYYQSTFLRVFDLAAMGYVDGMLLDTVNFASDYVYSPSNTTVNAYALSSALNTGNLTLLGSATVYVNNSYQMYSAAMGGIQVPANTVLVLSYSTNGNFDSGNNTSSETGPSYFMDPSCGYYQPQTYNDWGYWGYSLILDFNARPVSPTVLTLTSGLPSGSTFPVGTTTVTHSAANASGCSSSASFDVVVNPAAVLPSAPLAQAFCNTASVSNLQATVTGIKWYSAPAGGTPLLANAPLATGNYYITQTVGTCESPRLEVAVTINNTLAPTGAGTYVYAGTASINDIIVAGTGLQWYATATGGSPLSSTTAVIDGTTYYASQTVNGCESPTRLTVTVKRISDASQIFCTAPVPTVANLAATPASGLIAQWYTAATGGTALAPATSVSSGSYYVSQGTAGTTVMVSTVAGSSYGYADGDAATAQFNVPYGVATDASGNMYVADMNNHKIRKITPEGVVTTFAGGWQGFADGLGASAQFKSPAGVAVDASGNVYVADLENHKIRKITPSGLVSTLAGSTPGYADGTGSSAQFNNPSGVASDASGNVYVVDTGNNKIRKITPLGIVSTLAGSTPGYADGSGTSAQFSYPQGIAADASGNVYVADSGNDKIRKITPAGVVSTIAGSTWGYSDGIGTSAQFNYPSGVAADASGNVYVSDAGNYKIRKITSSGVVTTLAGSTGGYSDGEVNAAQFYYPSGLVVDALGTVYIADAYNNKIRKITQPVAESNRAEVTVNVTSPTVTIAQTNASCNTSNGVATASVTGGTAPYNYSWDTTPSFNTAQISNLASGTYTVTVTDANSCTTTGTATILSVAGSPPSQIQATDTDICLGSTVKMPVAGGAVSGVKTIGTANSLTGPQEQPTAFNNRWSSYTSQTIYTKEELEAAGIMEGPITALSYNVNTLGDAATNPNFTVKIGTTPASNFANTTLLNSTAFTTVFGPATYTHTATGWNTITFTTPFIWDGESNIVIHTTMNGADSTNNAQTYFTATADNKVLWVNSQTSTIGQLSQKRLNVKLNANIAGEMVYSPVTNLYTDAAATVPYTGTEPVLEDEGLLVYVKPTAAGPVTYSITSLDPLSSCAAVPATVVISGIEIPAVIITDPVISCASGTVDLTSPAITAGSDTGLVYTYWSDAGATIQLTSPEAIAYVGTYYIKATNTGGCSVVVPVTITQAPLALSATTIATNAACNNSSTGSATVAVTGGTPGYTYSWLPSGGTAATAAGLPAGTYTATVTDANGCTATALATISITADSEAPDLVCPANIAVSNDAGECGAVITVPAPTFTEDCTLASVCVDDNIDAYTTGSIAGQSPQWVPWAATSLSGDVSAEQFHSAPQSIKISGMPTGGPVDQVYKLGNHTSGVYEIRYFMYVPTGNTAFYNIQKTETLGTQWGSQVFFHSDGTARYTINNGAVTFNYPQDEWFEVFYNINIDTNVTSFSINGAEVTTHPNSWQALGTGGLNAFGAINFYPENDTVGEINPSATPLFYIDDINFCELNSAVPLNSFNNTANGSGNYPVGTTNVVWTIADATGNTASCTQQITVTDTEAPVITCPPNITLVSCTDIAATFTAPTVFDNCQGATIVQTGGLSSGALYPVGITTNTFVATDAAGNTSICSFTVSVNPPAIPLTITPSQTNVSCFAGNDGILTATVSGGTTPYSYSWNNGADTVSIANLTAGTYSVTVTDAVGCIATHSFMLTQPTVLSATTVVTNVACNGGNTGAINITPSGGTAPYSFNWGGGITTEDRTGLTAGNYSVTITDANGCNGVVNATVTQPASALGGTTVITNVACNGGNTGAINLTPSGGTAPYTFNWAGGVTTEDRAGVMAGSYSVTITDLNGCTATITVPVSQPESVLSASYIVTNVACNSGNTGAINITPSGGTAPYTFNWGGGVTTEDRAGLTAGSYSVTITDLNGCTATITVAVSQPASALSASFIVTNVACNGGNNGAINLTPSGGTAPYTFNWGGGVTTEDRTGLTAGNYSVTITDANGCNGVVNATVTQPASALGGTTVISNVACNGGNNGAINLTPSGGTGPYTYNWGGGITTEDRTGLTAGSYSVTITDANNCTATITVPVSQPASALSASFVVNNVACNGGNTGAINLTPSGGTAPYTFNWGGGITTEDRTGLSAGNYAVTITDANSCTSVINVSVIQPNALTVATSQTNILCNGASTGSATVAVTGGTGAYSYAWNTVPVQTSATANGLAAGTYTVTITDANNCSTTRNFTITQPNDLNVALVSTNVSCPGGSDGTASATVTGGVVAYTYLWSNGGTTATITGLTAGTYTVTVTDGNNCSVVKPINVQTTPDVTAPIANVAILPTVTAQCAITTGTITTPTATDNCAGTLTATTSDPLTYATQGTYVITWTYNDVNGNTTTQTQNVVVDDTIVPIANVATLPTITAQCAVTTGTITAPTATDNCAGTLTATTTNPLTYAAQGTYVITWTYNDGNGNTTTQTQNVVVDDTIAPIANVATLPTVNAQCAVTAGTITAPTATDNCAGTLTATTTNPLTYATQGTYLITWTYNDSNGNTTTQTQNVVVDDTIAPTANVATLPTITAQCAVTAGTITAPTATDNCAGTLTATTTNPLTYAAQGTYLITWTYNDSNGNTTTQTQNVVVDDTIAPTANVATLPTITAQCAVNTGTITAPTATDNCTGTMTATTIDPLTYTAQGTYVITWTYNDSNGNTTTQTQNVVVDDTIAPIANVATLPTVNAQCAVTAGTITAPTATDNCAGTLTATTTNPLTYAAQGTYLITWTYNDSNGNTTTQTQNVVVDDTIAPTANVATLPTITAQCAVNTGTITAPTATDNCTGTMTATTIDPLTYTAQGTYVITWTYNDSNGNTTTQTQNVVVDDTIAPIANVATLPTVNAQCAVTAGTITAPTATDNCAGTLTATTTNPLTYATQGTYLITWTYNDSNGNTTTQTQNVVVDDTIAPIANVVTLPTITAQCAVTAGTITAPTATDNCAGTLTATTTNPLTYAAQGTYVITWTYNDGNGNTTTQTQNVVVDDTNVPVANVATLPTVTAQCAVTAGTITAPTATDNCAGTLTATTTDPLTYSTQGTYVITWTYNDGNGNTATQTQNVIVDDTIAPIASVATLPTITAQCAVTAGTITAPTATDNCAGTVTAITTSPLTYTAQGTYVITWTYKDGNGNTTTQTQNVVVDDTIAPVANISILPTITAQCAVTAGTIAAPTATDNCAGTLTATTTNPLTYNAQGTYVITWIYNDGNGNTATQTQNVIVDDTMAPVGTVAPLPTVNAQCGVTAGMITAPTATDNCAGTLTAITTDPLTYNAQGTYVITWIYNDGNGNTTTQTQNVVVDDTLAPIANVATLPTVIAQCAVTTGTITAPTATDNCVGTLTATTTDPLTYSTQGTYVITWTYNDGNGNTTTQTQNVVVDDTTAPVVNVATLPTITAQCAVNTGTITAPTATDNCAGTITASTSDPLVYTTQGTYVITWTHNDGNGNITTQTQNVVVDDTIAPIANVATLPTVTAQCAVTAGTITAPTATDNCSGTLTATTSDPLTYNAQGTYVITWTYNDGNGNSTTQTQNVVVDDTIAPVANVATLPAITNYCQVLAAEIAIPTATDNCTGLITATTSDALEYTATGTYVITWSYDDGNGNAATQQQTINVLASPLDLVTFTNATYTYNTAVQTITVSNLPAGASATYMITPETGTGNGAINAGTYTVTAVVTPPADASNCDPITLSAVLTIEKAPQQIIFAEIPVKNLENDPDFQLGATSTSGLPVYYTYVYTSPQAPATITPGGFVDMLTSGEVTITAHQDGNENYLPATPVEQLLIIESSNSNIGTIVIGDETFINPGQEMHYLVDCNDTSDSVAVSIVTEAGASVIPGHNFIIETPRPGIYTEEVTVISQDGSTTSDYTIVVERRFAFFDIVEQKFDNVLLVNNNPETNGGYKFVAYQWYRNSQLIGTDQYYSAGDAMTEMLDPTAEYYVRMTTVEGDVLQTCVANIEIEHSFNARLFPNPAVVGSSVTIEADFPVEELRKMTISIYSITGQLVTSVASSTATTVVQLPAGIEAATYIVLLETPNIWKSFKVIVKK